MITETEYDQRRDKLQKLIEVNELDAFVVSDSEAIYYFTGATYKVQERPFFIIFWSDKDPTFLVPKLEEEHMKKWSIGDVITYWEFPSPEDRSWVKQLTKIIQDCDKVGIQPSISLENYNHIADNFNGSLAQLGLVRELRLIKSKVELEKIRHTCEVADRGMMLMLDNAYYGVSVLEMFSVSRDLQMDVIKTGFYDPLQTEFLTACWPAPFSAQPHGVPAINALLKSGPNVAMSYHRINGHAAECERTFFLSEPSLEERELFGYMMEARRRALAKVKAGVHCDDVDKAAMDYLKEQGFEENLLHRTGHGIGLGNHEGPWVAEGSGVVLEKNMVISIEPGIYLPEVGGFRHSDTVLVTNEGYELLTKFPVDLESLTITNKRWLKKLKGSIVKRIVKMRPEKID